jgi:hypothetical protein
MLSRRHESGFNADMPRRGTDMEKPTRRELAVIAAASLAIGKAIAETPPPAADADLYKAALDSHNENSMILAQFQIPMSTEPAFQFKA